MMRGDANSDRLPVESEGPVLDGAMTRSEEELYISTRRRESRVARLARYVETETVTRTVEVRHEQVRVEYAPITTDGDDPAIPTSGLTAGGQWMVLYDEEVVVTTRRVPRERVRLQVHTVTEDREVSEALRKERIEVSDAGRSRVRDATPGR